MGWFDTSENIVIFDQGVIIDVFGGGEIDGLGIFDPNGAGDRFDGFGSIAGDDFDFDVVGVKILDDLMSITADFVGQTNKA